MDGERSAVARRVLGALLLSLAAHAFLIASFKPVSESDPHMKDLGPYQLLKVWDPHARSFVVTSNATTESSPQACPATW
jgi:hypothetical protein